MRLPADHPERVLLNDEVHARPPEPLSAPSRVSYLALYADAAAREQAWQAVHDLAVRFGAAPPQPGANHYSADLGPFRLRWERHTEFVRYSFIAPGGEDAFADPVMAAVPADWVAALPGRLMVAAHVALVRDGDPPADPADLSRRLFAGTVPVGAGVLEAAGAAFTDFRIHPDGFSRVLVLDRAMTPGQAGRTVQRLLEIDTYRMVALLALPVAQASAPVITRCERELAGITAAMVTAGEADDPALLERLTRLAAEIDSRQADNLYRFSASVAYDELVHRRIAELRESRLPGLQTWQEFTDRRFAPAMNTCRSVAARQEELSRRVARATQLLATRVGVTRERQNQSVLEVMNRRVKLQLRLQTAVEGFSIAAVTYYIVGLVGYVAKALKAAGVPVEPDVAMGVSIPVVAALMALGVRRTRRLVSRSD